MGTPEINTQAGDIGMSDLSLQIQVDGDRCEQEPIRFPGSIQPSGVLLCVDEDQGSILAVSANHSMIPVLNGPLHAKTLYEVWPDLAVLPEDGAYMVGDDYFVHRRSCDRTLFFEIEPVTAADRLALARLIDLKLVLSKLHDDDTLECVTQTAAMAIRSITGMERVLIYRFDADGNGEVLAESKVDDWDESFVGFHFPAADIPAQARNIYLASLYRFVSHRDYEPVPLIPDVDPRGGQPFNLSRCSLRSLSPVHRIYQENLGVDGAMSISIINEGRLWGLVVGHHRRPHRVSIPAREQVLALTISLSMRLSVTETAAERKERAIHGSLHTKLLEQIAGTDDFSGALLNGDITLADFFSSVSAAVTIDCESNDHAQRWDIHSVGDAPAREVIVAIANACRSRMAGGIFHTDHLVSLLPEALRQEVPAAGLLAATVGEHGRHMILWFRPELIRTIVWGGASPAQVNEEKAAGNYLPRQSFSRWVEEHRHHSAPWAPWMVEIARSIRTAVNDNILRQLRTIRGLNALLTERDQAKSRFLAHMSHELRAPLNTVVGYSDMLDSGDWGALTDGQREAVTCIREASAHLLSMVNDILDLSKVEAGKMEVQLAPVDLIEILRRIITLQTGVAHACKVAILRNHPTELPQLMVDERLVRQMLFNLLSNALKFTPEGGTVTVSTRLRNDGGVTLEVADTGIGIPKAKQASVLEPFRQAHDHLAQGHPGTGLGLPIVKSLIELHGGRLVLESDEGRGTSVRLDFPPTATVGVAKTPVAWPALRAATTAAHKALEGAPALKRILAPDVTTADLGDLLRRFVTVYRPLEARLIDRQPASNLGFKSRLPLLIRGLATLGLAPPATDAEIPPLDSEASRWGALYVIEGATMGGQLIHRHLASRFPSEALEYFLPHGLCAGENWRCFLASLEIGINDPNAQEEAKASAITIFSAFRQAMTVQ